MPEPTCNICGWSIFDMRHAWRPCYQAWRSWIQDAKVLRFLAAWDAAAPPLTTHVRFM